ncbi:Na+/H+ antiporter subunit A [Fictibacillus fluitans]|uniref:Na+/H+ antiporter subunit A n=1 Tax=Fictibacillus fluitans TaxID=3058422 RepID=A0ABT8HXJ2_9BACL|nr:Na+/H+ antiporter subunit A [Fictibacillus sp. NE201]MDN4525471.1 Na+/H+ antiporter subunit A [Fictibacillus sp. NE201]
MFLYYIALPFIAALLLSLFSRPLSKTFHNGWLVALVPLVLFILFLTHSSGISEGLPAVSLTNWIPSMGIQLSFYLDGLSLLFTLLITGIGFLVVLYSVFYLSKKENLIHFYIYLLLFMGSMLGLVLSDNLFVLYTFWEFTSISSFLLIGFWSHRARSVYGALKSMMITVFGGLSMLGGFLLLWVASDTTSIREIISQKEEVMASPLFTAILLLVLIGAFSKSAQFPFHTWLPDAMEAPTPVSAYLHSATMVKAGIYLVARLSLLFSGSDVFFLCVSGFGLITLCWGSFMAVRQTDLKGILAFSTISQLGMIMAMLGFGSEAAIFAAVFHIFNHATFKGSLFMVAGIVDHETGTRDIRKLGGLMTFMPITATLAFFGTFSMAGFPLPIFNGFLSKEMFFDASLQTAAPSGLAAQAAPLFPYLAVLGSIFTFVYSMYLFFGTFRGKVQLDKLEKKPHEAPYGMLIAPFLLVCFIVVIGLLPNLINEHLLAPAAGAVAGTSIHMHLAFWHGIKLPLIMSLIVVATGALLFLFKRYWERIYRYLPGKLSADKAYQALLNGLLKGAKKTTASYMTGSLSLYLSIIVLFLICVTAGMMAATGGFAFSTDDLSPIQWPEVITGIAMLIAAIATIFMKRRIAAVIVIGVVGYGLALLFVLFRAPDLALTQLIIETVTVVLFLLCFSHLPVMKPNSKPLRSKVADVLISLAAGALVTLVAISSHSSKWFQPISDYFVKTSYSLGGGKNIVNVILVDFRGLDTMFEITVLGLAALGIYGMIKIRLRKKGGMEQ